MKTLVALSAMVLALVQTPAPGVEGTWRGTLATPTANLRLVLNISRAADGLLSGLLESLDQSTIPIDSLTVNGDTVQVSLKAINASFTGKLNAARTEIAGTFTQGGALPLTFTRSTTATPPAPAPPPVPVTAATFPLGLPLDLRVPVAPTPFTGHDGRTYLAYELHVTNMSGRDLMLYEVEVINTTTTVLTLQDTDLNRRLMALEPRPSAAPSRRAGAPLSSSGCRSPRASSRRPRCTIGLRWERPRWTPPSSRRHAEAGDDWAAARGGGLDGGQRTGP